MVDKWTKYFVDVAQRTAELSYAVRLKVGVVAARDKRIICCGYNGTPAGADNTCEYQEYDEQGGFFLTTKPEVSHAEENMITFAAKKGISLEGTSLYLTHAPCINCAKLIFNSGINKIIYVSQYKDDQGLRYLQKEGVEVIQYVEEK